MKFKNSHCLLTNSILIFCIAIMCKKITPTNPGKLYLKVRATRSFTVKYIKGKNG